MHRAEDLALASILAAQAAFQACLAVGAPWGGAAYGGNHQGALPGGLRALSAAAVPLYALAAGVVASPGAPRRARLAVSGATAVAMTAGTLANAASPFGVERAIWTPVTTVAALLAVRSALRTSRATRTPL